MKYAILVFSFICLLEPVKAQPVLKDADIDQILKFVESYQGRKPVMMNFWATWCGPCKEEFPYIMKLKEKYPEDFGLIFVSADFEEAREEAEVFLQQQGVDFTTYFKVGDDNNFISKISDNWTGALPFTVIYSKSGEVLSEWEGKADFSTFESKLQHAINQ